MLLDIFVMGITYKLYYKRSILNELKEYDSDIFVKDQHIYIPANKKNILGEDESVQPSQVLPEIILEEQKKIRNK